ncbi:MAG TPA: hypothetical protein ENK72_00665 [Epsilonproteobacteria bacterium]|nr:hypothetical protein [Campylobacterota bacterium]
MWNTAPFWGSSRGLITSQKVNISAYEVLAHLLMSIILSGNFPHLKQIVILGHSAGGQLVNRYAASNTIEETFNIPVKYMVMAPSSYLYFTDERICDKREKKFCKLKEKDKQLNRWGYGTEKLYGYHKRHHITPHSMKRRYQHATILYLVGENDDKRDASLSTHIGAMAQGNHRKERAMIYYNYLQHLFGSDITRNQKLVIVPNVGHWGKGLMRSREGTQFILFD